MGTIKDITDLTIDLINSTQDRKLTTKITAIQSLIASFQSEHFAVIEKNTELLMENFELKQKISELEKTNAELKNNHAEAIATVTETHGKEMSDLTEKYRKRIAAFHKSDGEPPLSAWY
jgi:regulator of replication initiation timing